jgi:hypothetical protein
MTIQKLERTLRHEIDSDFTISEPVSIGEMQEKINELVDAVNVLQAQVAILEEHAHPTARTETADPYAEQRKWIGKLCHFWNKTEYTDDIYGFLTDIVPTNKYNAEDNYFVPFKDEFGSFYEHCEPVKPDDDIIYKGE